MPRKYEIDNNNRLVVIDDDLTYPVDGFFTVDRQNNLSYLLNEPQAWRTQRSLPDKITFIGNWKLNENYCLELKLKDDQLFLADSSILTLKGKIISLEADEFTFELKTIDKSGLLHLGLIKLSGQLNNDEFNQIFFSVEKLEGTDILFLGAGWRLNKNQEITFNLKRTPFKNKSDFSSLITISGFWRISQANNLTYFLSTASGNSFIFRCHLQTPSLYPKKGAIKYRLGAGISQGRRVKTKIISLYGTWKLSRGLGISFEMEYANGRLHSLEFEAEITIDKANRVVFILKSAQKEALGISVTFTHRFLKQLDARVFLELKSSLRERGIDVGLIIPF